MMDTAKAAQIIDDIAKDITRWDQTTWTNIGLSDDSFYGDVTAYKEKTEENQIINCGTTACIAGHGAFIFAPVGTQFFGDHIRFPLDKETNQRPRMDYPTFTGRTLELTRDEEEYLFSGRRTWEQILAFVRTDDAGRHAILVGEFGSPYLTCNDEGQCSYSH